MTNATNDPIIYCGYVLIAHKSQTGTFMVEVAPIGSDRSVFTPAFAQLEDALAMARRIVDNQTRVLH